ncbi:hypothetical protein M5362_27335 [Streptomyces sp. Je 1-79]|uniref:hypothetical protein n=1 Tax=Streptomyces sp. Je 1-79 TaxID=2943847 RepID=UPI0021A7DA6D|nr:hypothetical protein [Streptomyces sp. Je 1-79]MCT4356839.1 hypothetical protein [Streptomyces sp. Je 1-79]
MGIESDQLVFDYLSRVGDLAQQRQLPSATRMRLVSSLRGEIDRRRATYGEESPTAVRSLLDELGTPDEVVDRATGTTPVARAREGAQGPDGPKAPGVADGPKTWGAAAGPDTSGVAREAVSDGPEASGRRGLFRKGGRSAVPAPRAAPAPGPTPPHLAGTDEVGSADTDPDWWRLEEEEAPRPGDDLVPGFRGGVEIPELLKPPPEETEGEAEDGEDAGEESGSVRRPAWRRVLSRRRAAGTVASSRRFRPGGLGLVLAALLLLGGAVFGSLVALALGWLLAYASRRLSRAEAQGAVVVLPLLAATAGAVWLWGRVEGRWGEPVAVGGEGMGAAVSETWPWTLKGAAIASALFLLWRARRHSD